VSRPYAPVCCVAPSATTCPVVMHATRLPQHANNARRSAGPQQQQQQQQQLAAAATADTGSATHATHAAAQQAVPHAFLRLAHDLADAAALVTSQHFRSSTLNVDSKSDASPVTIADREAEAAMRRLVAARQPAHSVFGEEAGLTRGVGGSTSSSGGGGEQDSWLWVLDPIDGTKSFITGARVCLGGAAARLLRDAWRACWVAWSAGRQRGACAATHAPCQHAQARARTQHHAPARACARPDNQASRCLARSSRCCATGALCLASSTSPSHASAGWVWQCTTAAAAAAAAATAAAAAAALSPASTAGRCRRARAATSATRTCTRPRPTCLAAPASRCVWGCGCGCGCGCGWVGLLLGMWWRTAGVWPAWLDQKTLQRGVCLLHARTHTHTHTSKTHTHTHTRTCVCACAAQRLQLWGRSCLVPQQ
jgi:hypothetical protein